MRPIATTLACGFLWGGLALNVSEGIAAGDLLRVSGAWVSPTVPGQTVTGADLDGQVAIDRGVYGVPEAFVVDRDGRIAYKFIGPVTSDVPEKKLRPLVASLRSGGAAAQARRRGAQ